MKKYIATITFVFLFCPALFAQVNQLPIDSHAGEFKFEEGTWDIGYITQNYPDSNSRTHDFVFTNVGKRPITISNCQGEEGLTIVEWPKNPITPGQKGVIRVICHIDYSEHFFYKAITITSNAKTPLKTLYISGTVMSRGEPGELTFNERIWNFGNVPLGQPVTYIFHFTNTGKNKVTLYNCSSNDSCTTPYYWNIEPISPGQKKIVDVTYKPTKLGAFKACITVSSTAKTLHQKIYIKGTVVRPDSGAGEIKFDTSDWHFEYVPQKNPLTHDFHFTNIGNKPVLISSCYSRNPGIVDWPHEAILPGKSGVIKITQDVSNTLMTVNYIHINSNAKIADQIINVHGYAMPAKPDPSQLHYPSIDASSRLFGYKNSDKQWVIKPVFRGADPFKGLYAKVGTDSGCGLINMQGEFIFRPVYSGLLESGYGYFICYKNKQEGIINANGKQLLPLTDSLKIEYDYNNGYSLETSRKKYGYIDVDGNYILPMYDAKLCFGYQGRYDVSFFKLNDKTGLIKRNGDIIISVDSGVTIKELDSCFYTFKGHYNSAYDFQVYNWNGKPLFDNYLDDFFENFNRSQSNIMTGIYKGKYILFDYTGKLIVNGKYQWIGPFNPRGMAVAGDKNKFVLIDEKGKTVFGPCDSIAPFGRDYLGGADNQFMVNYNYTPFQKNDKWGVIDDYGEVVIQPTYDKAKMKNTCIYGSRDEPCFYLEADKDGQPVEIPLTMKPKHSPAH